jgi:hypothetical protein
MSRIPKAVSEYLAAIGSKGDAKAARPVAQSRFRLRDGTEPRAADHAMGQRSPEPAGTMCCHKTKNRAHPVTERAQGVA